MITVSVIVPAYNEEKTILSVLQRIREQRIEGVTLEVVVVDDGSIDQTGPLLEAHPELHDRLIRQANGGKGSAVRAGMKAASGDYILFQDADLEYDPAEYGRLLMPVLRFNADLVMGSRFVAPEYTRVYYFWHRVGNDVITLIFNIFNNTTFTDIYSCYLMFRRPLVDPDGLISNGWEQQAEILSRAVAAGTIYYEVPISYHGRTYAEGKKIRAHHALAVIAMILRRWLGRMFGR
ncbi:MAG: glycosyltransferase family 2 protein [Magnetococcales bacterium]|nr:glycosyltransferase family 2 protein [Magnetococcales bacterium]